MIKWLEKLLIRFGLIRFKTRTVHKHHIHTIKRPENDSKRYLISEYSEIMSLRDSGKTYKQIGKMLGRTEGAVKTKVYRFNKSTNN